MFFVNAFSLGKIMLAISGYDPEQFLQNVAWGQTISAGERLASCALGVLLVGETAAEGSFKHGALSLAFEVLINHVSLAQDNSTSVQILEVVEALDLVDGRGSSHRRSCTVCPPGRGDRTEVDLPDDAEGVLVARAREVVTMSMEESSRPGEGTNMSVSVVMGNVVDFQAGPEGFLRALGATCGHIVCSRRNAACRSSSPGNISRCEYCCSRGSTLGEDDLVFPRDGASVTRISPSNPSKPIQDLNIRCKFVFVAVAVVEVLLHSERIRSLTPKSSLDSISGSTKGKSGGRATKG